MAPKIKTKNLTTSQEKIVKDLIAEFETLNAQESVDSDDLCAYIDNALDERKRKRDDVDRKNQLTVKRHIEYLTALVSDIRPLAKRYHIDIDMPTSMSSEMIIRLKFCAPENNNWVVKKIKNIKVRIHYTNVEGKTLYCEMDKLCIQFFTDDYTFKLTDKASLPKQFADEIIRFRKDYNIYK
jgi:hypothetical protein